MPAGFIPLLDLAASTVGWVAAVTVLVAHGLMMSGRIGANGVTYLSANAAGSAGLAMSMAVANAWQSAVVNALWLVFGIAPLLRVLRRRGLPRWDSAAQQAVRIVRSCRPVDRSADRRESVVA